MSHERIDQLPDYLDDERGVRYWLTLNKTLDGTWSAAYTGYIDNDYEETQDTVVLCGYVNDCLDLNEIYIRMTAKLKRQKRI